MTEVEGNEGWKKAKEGRNLNEGRKKGEGNEGRKGGEERWRKVKESEGR